MTKKEGASAAPAIVTRRAREQLLHLLVEAAELEHNLLCSYLYAAFSLKRGAAEDLLPHELAAVERWRKLILSVAHEEMAHLVLASNLMVAVGARAHFNRPNFPVPPGYHPAGIVARLAPFGPDTMDHFIFLERPEGMPLSDAETFKPAVPYVRGERPAALMPGACDYSTIGEFYAAVRDCLIDVASDLGGDALFSGPASAQVGPEVVSLPGVALISDLASALSAVETIVVQGEGAPAEAADSHFERFRRIKAEYEALRRERPAFEPARAIADDPVMRRPVTREDRVHVSEPRAAAVLDLANALYNHMLRLLTQAFGRADAQPDARRELVDAAVSLMGLLGAVSDHLTTLPAEAPHAGVRAGITFTMLRATEPLVEHAAERRILAERFEELAEGTRAACRGHALEARARELDALARKFRAAPARA
jgi:hypothetical protein